MTEEEELKKLEPKNKIIFDKDGIPCIIVPPVFHSPIPMGNFEIHFFEFNPKKFPPRNFTELQQEKDKNFLNKVLKDLEEMFKGWF